MECSVKHTYGYNTRISEDVAFSSAAINLEIEEVHNENASAVCVVETDIKQGGSFSVQIEKENENSVQATEKEQNDPEAFQHCGLRRRCLQFEDALHTVIPNRPAQSPLDCTVLKSPLGKPLVPTKEKQEDKIQLPYPTNMNTIVKVPKPSGIGLHLNSILSASQAGSGAIVHVKSAQGHNFTIRGKRSTPIINCHLSDSSNSSSVVTLAENVLASMDDIIDNRHESHAILEVNSVTSLSTTIVKCSNDSIILNPVDDQSTPGNKRKYTKIETDRSSGEFKLSPKKKRKNSSDSIDGDGCKRCNCKKSQCLKLYCDCFAAGIYCAESCACQACHNRPDYENTVLETRQQIESRNPLAFAPKIEDGTHFSSSSARHKRGCSCKKSMCLKKYCECYQANVGCSDGCRCEGCKNVYGQKGEYGMDKVGLSEEGTNEGTDGSSIEKVTPPGNVCLYHSEVCNPHNSTPLTPAVQFFNHRKDATKACNHSGKCFQSPESSVTFATPDTNYVISETAGEILDFVSSDKELYYVNAEMQDEFSTVCLPPGNLSGLPNHQEQAKNSKAQSFSGINHHSSMSSVSWRVSPNTPGSQFNASKPLKVVDLDDELSNNMQDDTPDILMDSPTPLNAVKVRSPNKKRVSPPHAPQQGSNSVDGLRIARKFILKAVPSFPPLTPCADSKMHQTSAKK